MGHITSARQRLAGASQITARIVEEGPGQRAVIAEKIFQSFGPLRYQCRITHPDSVRNSLTRHDVQAGLEHSKSARAIIRTESLRTKVSVAGKRNFQGRDREAETATEVQGRPCRDKISLATPPIRG